MNFDLHLARKLLSEKLPVFVRYKFDGKGSAPHLAGSLLIDVNEKFAIVKPIKHGGPKRLERVPTKDLKLWHSRNESIYQSLKNKA